MPDDEARDLLTEPAVALFNAAPAEPFPVMAATRIGRTSAQP
ncbi:hypothetical protein [Paractinoplanes brasiliensis]|nr:hypothetical protein [Actinoplanes brasiliensis]